VNKLTHPGGRIRHLPQILSDWVIKRRKLQSWAIMTLCLAGLLALTACDSSPVVVVATPVPPDASFHTYHHPSGVFSIRLPTDWSVRDLSQPDAVRVEFSPPDNTGLPLTVYVVNTGNNLDAASFLDAIGKYEAAINGSASVYTEVSRTAQGDGSWRLTGIRQTPIGPRTLNTFLQADKSFLSAVEVDITDANDQMQQTMRAIVNTYRVDTTAVIKPGDISAEQAVGVTTSSGVLVFSGLFDWTNSQGAFIVNGEVTNKSGGPLEAIRVTATLYDADSHALTDQGNVVSTEVLQDGASAPFSIQFRNGKPSQAVRYELEAAGRSAEYAIKDYLGDDQFIHGNDKASYNASGYLTISGDVVNKTQAPAHFVKATVAVLDEKGRVVATDSVFLSKPDLLSGEAGHFEVTFFELGGSAIRYLITIEGKTTTQ